MVKVRIRPLAWEDIPEVAEHHQALMPPGEGWGEAAWRWELEQPLRYPWVAERAGRIVGVVSFWDEGDALYLATLLVWPSHRRLGIGSRLVQKGVALARRLRRPRVLLHVRQDNKGAQRFYRHLGFSLQRAQAIRYPDGTPGDLWEYRLDSLRSGGR